MKVLIGLLMAAVLPYICYSMPGGRQEYHIEGPPRKDPFIQFAMKAVNDFKQDSNPWVLVRVVEAYFYIVAGVRYVFIFEVTGGDENLGNENCKVSLWSREWLEGPEKLKVNGPVHCRKKPVY